jgi:TonB-linked SusC/RagA family outer membrane protein
MRLHKYCLGLFLFPILQLTAQKADHNTNSSTYQLAGRVTNDKGEPLSGATVIIQGIKKQTLTNENGEYIIKNIQGDKYSVEISHIGYAKMIVIVEINRDMLLNKTLNTSLSNLDETVVKGYYNTTKQENTGDVTTIKSDVIERQPVANVLQAIEGRVPGMFVQQTDGLPGGGFTVQIRGTNSIQNGTNPLYIVDGVPIVTTPQSSILLDGGLSAGAGSLLNYLNPADVENISVLKDADATAIYGSRGANGVVLITTKLGKPGRPVLSGSLAHGMEEVTDPTKWAGTPDYLRIRHQAYANDGITTIPATHYDINGTWDTTRSTNWQNVLAGNQASYTDAMIALSGGSGNAQYLFDGTYRKESTVFPTSFGGQKIALHLTTSGASNDQKAHFRISGSYLVDNNRLPNQDPSGVVETFAPDAPPVYAQDGKLNWANSTWTNPYATLLQLYKSASNNLVGAGQFNYEMIRGLNLSINVGYNRVQVTETNTTPLASMNPTNALTNVSNAAFVYQTLTAWNVEPQLSYVRRIGKGKLSALAGITLNESTANAYDITAYGYTNDALMSNINGASSVSANAISDNTYKYTSGYGQLGYEWNERYILNLTGRRDGSSRFGPGRQFANFGAVGGAWIFSHESFLKNNKVISFGKLRGSYGSTGNDQIGDYQYLPVYNSDAGSANTYMQSSYLLVSGIFNANYAWEVNKKLEGAVELDFFRNRIGLTANFYRNISNNQLLNYPLTTITGTTNILENLPAKVQNEGSEFTLKTVNVQVKNFSWTTQFNITIYRNKLLAYLDLAESSLATTLIVGKSLHIARVYQGIGVNDTTGVYEFKNAHGNATYTPSTTTDRVGVVNLDPSFFGGFENSFVYKFFTLDLFFNFVKQIGKDPVLGGGFAPPGYPKYNFPAAYESSYWQRPGDHVRYEKPTTKTSTQAYMAARNAQQSTLAYINASYIRLANVYFAYDLPGSVLRKINFQSVKIFAQGQNLLTITSLKTDPESKNVLSTAPLRIIACGLRFAL